MMRLFKMILSTAAVLIYAFPASAWLPIAHYSMQRDLGVDENQMCMNLPDAWPCNSGNTITQWFSWSHALQTKGYYYGIPYTPTYPDDGRYPGYDIYQLATKKTSTATPQNTNAAYSFIGHNGMDRPVHYDFFLGAVGNNWWSTGMSWLVQHRKKEQWAEYVIFYDSRRGNGSFNESGIAMTFFGIVIDHNDSAQVLIPCHGDARIIQIAQKIYRKNRRFTDSDNSGHISEVDTIEMINARMQNLQQEMNMASER